jgi:hypothetical protein
MLVPKRIGKRNAIKSGKRRTRRKLGSRVVCGPTLPQGRPVEKETKRKNIKRNDKITMMRESFMLNMLAFTGGRTEEQPCFSNGKSVARFAIYAGNTLNIKM